MDFKRHQITKFEPFRAYRMIYREAKPKFEYNPITENDKGNSREISAYLNDEFMKLEMSTIKMMQDKLCDLLKMQDIKEIKEKLPELYKFVRNKKYLPSLLKLGNSIIGPPEHKASFFRTIFPNIREEFNNDKLRPDIIKMTEAVGDNAYDFFRYGFKKIRKEFNNDKLRPDIIKMTEAVGDNAYYFFAYGFKKIRKEFNNDKLRPDIIKMVQSEGKNADTLFQYVFSIIRKEFHSDKLRPDIVKMTEVAGDNAYRLFAYGFPNIREEFNNDKLRPDIIKMNEAVGKNAHRFFQLQFPKIREEFNNDKLRTDIVKMTEAAGDNVDELFGYGFPEIREEFKKNGYDGVKGKWNDLLKMAEAAGDSAYALLRYGFPEIRKEFHNDKLRPDIIKMTEVAGENALKFFREAFPKIRKEFHNDKLRPDIIKMAEAAGDNAYALFRYGFRGIREEFHNDKLRPDIVKMAEAAGDNADEFLNYGFTKIRKEFHNDKLRPDIIKMTEAAGENAYYFFTWAFSEIREEFNNDKLRPDIVKMAEAAGDNARYLFEYGFPDIRKEFNKNGYEGVKGKWNDLLKMAEAAGENALKFFREAFPKIRKEFNNDKLRPDIIKMTQFAGSTAHELFASGFPNIRKEFNNDKLRPTLINVLKVAGGTGYILFGYLYKKLKNSEIDISNEKEIMAFARSFRLEYDRYKGGEQFYTSVISLKNELKKPFLETLQMLNDHKEGDSEKLVNTINNLYLSGSRNLKPLKSAFEVLYIYGGDELSRFTKEIDIDVIIKPYREKGNVEEKVLVARSLLQYMQTEKERLVKGLGLTKEEVDYFLATEREKPKKKLSNFYYAFKAYDLIGLNEEKQNVFDGIDIVKLLKEKGLVKEGLSLEVFGLLDEIELPIGVWEEVVEHFDLPLFNLKGVERARRKLLEISIEKANQIIEMKAKEYIEKQVTADNLDKKIKFTVLWANPKRQGLISGVDDRFVFDIYIEAAGKMKEKIKNYCFEVPCEGIEDWKIFNKAELVEINKVQMVLRDIAKKEEKEKVTEVAHPTIKRKKTAKKVPDVKKEREARMDFLRQWILENSQIAEAKGMIHNRQQLEQRLMLYSGFKQEGLEARMRLIREQVVSYINRGEKNIETEVAWKGGDRILKDILPELGIRAVGSADNIQARLGKVVDRPLSYTFMRAVDIIRGGERLEGEATFKEGFYFESGFSGGGEEYEGERVKLDNDKVHPSADLYTIEREGETEAIVMRFDPKKGARFVFEVQVGATTEGNKGDLTRLFKQRYGKNLMLDTVGSMVQGAGMPISMIFEKGEPKNKKTTMEGQRDGLVVFNPQGRMEIVKKSEISYWHLARLVNMKSFERKMKKDIKDMENKLYSLLPEGEDLTDETLKSLSDKNPKLVRKYSKLMAIKDYFDQWKVGKPMNYASQKSYIPQELFWMISKHGKLSGFIESLYVEKGRSAVKHQGSAAHKRLLLQFNDGTYGIYDSRVAMTDGEVARKLDGLDINGLQVIHAVNLDTGMADDTRIYDKEGKSYQIGHTSQPVGTNRIGIYHKPSKKE